MAERIGITGHRWNRLDRACEAALADALAEAFAGIDRTPGPRTLVSGMAEGTDLVAARMRPPGWALEAVLPLDRPTWRAHLAGQPGVTEADLHLFDALMGEARVVTLAPAGGRPDYAALASLLGGSCDRVVAVWDGAPGRPGGTGSVVAEARARGARVLRIDPSAWMRT